MHRKIGVMGGTFDPVHHGHVVAASEVADRFSLDEVIFVPTGEPWLVDVGTALRCRVLSVSEVGASLLVAAEVVELLGLRRRGRPLVWVGRAYRGVPVEDEDAVTVAADARPAPGRSPYADG